MELFLLILFIIYIAGVLYFLISQAFLGAVKDGLAVTLMFIVLCILWPIMVPVVLWQMRKG